VLPGGTDVIDLSAPGLGARPGDPVQPPRNWADHQTSARTLLKAYRVVVGVEDLLFGLGLPRDELKRLRPLLLVLEAAVYEWDQQVEKDQLRGLDRVDGVHGDRILGLVHDIVAVDEGMRGEVDGLRRLFRVETEALRAVDGNEDLFLEICRWRSSDIRLQVRMIAALVGWPGDNIVEVL